MNKIALGTFVKFTEVAYVVRKQRPDSLWGTPVKGNYESVAMVGWSDDGCVSSDSFALVPLNGRLLGPTNDTNKNVLAVPRNGSGFVFGLERKLAGKSIAEPGWFEAKGDPIDLYVVKSELRGKPFYVPVNSLEVV